MTTCSYCIMDSTDPDIKFIDFATRCSHCWQYDYRAKTELHPGQFDKVISKIKTSAIGRPYDCIIGLSGGLDSSYVAYLLVKAGLKPFAIILDNGWDTECAEHNISAVVYKLDIPYELVRVNKAQYKDIQLSLLKASIKNAEAITDHIIIAKLYAYANKLRLKYIVHGGNIVTEAIMPKSWGYTAMDWKHIKSIHKQFGQKPIKDIPCMTLFDWFYVTFIKRIRWFPILNYTDYYPNIVKRILKKELGWQDYGHKHMENIYTRFFQGYILPKKFGIDKRKAHLSTLICSSRMTREKALKLMAEPYYRMSQMLSDHVSIRRYFNLSDSQFKELIEKKGKSHLDYPNNEKWFKRLSGLVEFSRKVAVSV